MTAFYGSRPAVNRPCPPWCAHDVRYDEGTPDEVLVHRGHEQTAETCEHPYVVQLQRWEYAASAEAPETHVRLDDTPLTPAQAVALGAALICESVRGGEDRSVRGGEDQSTSANSQAPLSCPPWCDLPAGHPWESGRESFRIHVRRIGVVVSLTSVEMLAGTVLRPRIDVADTGALDAEQARRLAGHLFAAAELLERAR